MSQNVGTPDWQRGVVSAQKLLGTFPSGSGTETVGIPPNAESLMILSTDPELTNWVTVKGVTSNEPYPTYAIPMDIGGGYYSRFISVVSNALDTEVLITWGVDPLGPWSVICDATSRFVLDGSVSAVTGRDGGSSPTSGLMVAGWDGTKSHILNTDSNGLLLTRPLAPTNFVTAVASGEILPALVSGAYYLFGADISTLTGPLIGTVEDGSGNYAALMNASEKIAGAGAGDHTSLDGYRTANAIYTTFIGANTDPRISLRYATGP